MQASPSVATRVRWLARSFEEWASHDGLDMVVSAVIVAEVMACVGLVMSV